VSTIFIRVGRGVRGIAIFGRRPIAVPSHDRGAAGCSGGPGRPFRCRRRTESIRQSSDGGAVDDPPDGGRPHSDSGLSHDDDARPVDGAGQLRQL